MFLSSVGMGNTNIEGLWKFLKPVTKGTQSVTIHTMGFFNIILNYIRLSFIMLYTFKMPTDSFVWTNPRLQVVFWSVIIKFKYFYFELSVYSSKYSV